MVQIQVHVGRIVSLQAEPGRESLFTLEDGSACVVSPQSHAFDFWSRLLTKSRQYAWPVYVASHPQTRQVVVLLPAHVHTVVALQPDPGQADRVRVAFTESHAFHFLRATRPGYELMKSRLEEAALSGRSVVVTENPRDPEIIDVRFAPDARAPATGSG